MTTGCHLQSCDFYIQQAPETNEIKTCENTEPYGHEFSIDLPHCDNHLISKIRVFSNKMKLEARLLDVKMLNC